MAAMVARWIASLWVTCAFSHSQAFFAIPPLRRSHASLRSILHSLKQDNYSFNLLQINWSSLFDQICDEAIEIGSCFQIAFGELFQSDKSVSVADIVQLCDSIDSLATTPDVSVFKLFVHQQFDLRRRAIQARRYELLCKLLRSDYKTYVTTASFLSPSRIPRSMLPNVEDVQVPISTTDLIISSSAAAKAATKISVEDDETGEPLVPDCELDKVDFQDSLLDKLLLSIFRSLVEKNTLGVTSSKPGISGLLEQGRLFMLQPGQTAEAQHAMVQKTLGDLMTPVLPPFYRIFMAGIFPNLGTDWDGKQFGPWLYAPWLTALVTPTFFQFLVGPSRPNRRKDGQLGGLLVEKCKFLQESNCKGLCLHQCKLPAQQFFVEDLGVPLTVSPNFVTQECQWSFGQVPIEVSQDSSFPVGCLAGCRSRQVLSSSATIATAEDAESSKTRPDERTIAIRRIRSDLCSC